MDLEQVAVGDEAVAVHVVDLEGEADLLLGVHARAEPRKPDQEPGAPLLPGSAWLGPSREPSKSMRTNFTVYCQSPTVELMITFALSCHAISTNEAQTLNWIQLNSKNQNWKEDWNNLQKQAQIRSGLGTR